MSIWIKMSIFSVSDQWYQSHSTSKAGIPKVQLCQALQELQHTAKERGSQGF